MAVPLLDLKAQTTALESDLRAAFERVLASGGFILGPEVAAFEEALAAYVGTRRAVAVSSGTDALLMLLMARGIGPGDQVLVPDFTFFATASTVARTGAEPIFVDACPACYNLDPADALRKITPRTRALIPAHLFGQSAEMAPLVELAHARRLFLIEDAAQSLGATHRGNRCGSLGHAAAFSFYPTKNLSALGDAGAITTDDDALADTLREIRVHGMVSEYRHRHLGGNFRIDALQAAFLRCKLPHLDHFNAARAEAAAKYQERLKALPGAVQLDTDSCACAGNRPDGGPAATLGVPAAYPHNGHTWHQFTVLVPGEGRRDALQAHLRERQIGCRIYYPMTVSEQTAMQRYGPSRSCPTAHRISRQCLSLPMFPEITESQIDEVVGAIAAFLDGR